MSQDLYSNYVKREPSPRNAQIIRRWHRKLLEMYLSEFDRPISILEVGPGHGYFANECTNAGIEYKYCDTSPAVHEKMKSLGFHGELGLLHETSSSMNNFDLIWMSHVLEHSPDWLGARELVSEVRRRLSPNGRVVIISPDVLSWRREFWNVDWSHGYPTSLRNCVQLLSDVGYNNIRGWHHRNASSGFLTRALFALIALVPHRILDRILTPDRYRIGDGMVYSWKAVFGWRQIFVSGTREDLASNK